MAVYSAPENLRPKSFEDYKSFLQGNPSSISTGDIGQGAQNPAQGTAGAPSPEQAGPIQAQGDSTPQPTKWFDTSAPETTLGLLNPVTKGLTMTSQELESLGKNFSQDAGTLRNWQTALGPQTVEGLLNPQTTASSKEPAKQLLSASYSGPMQLDQSKLEAIKGTTEAIKAQADALKTGGGVQTALSAGVPGITPGEARFEAQSTFTSPDYQASLQALYPKIAGLQESIGKEAQSAEEFAKQRQSSEHRIAKQAQDALKEGRTGITSDIEKTLDESLASEAEAQRRWTNWVNGGKVGALGPDIQRQYMQSPAMQKREEAATAYSQIMGQYPGLPERGALPIGNWNPGAFTIIPEEGSYADEPWPWAERQAELERQFGTLGQYRDVAPGWNPLTQTASAPLIPESDIHPYVSMEQGTTPTYESVTTADQALVYNTIQELLGEAARLEQSGDPYKASQIRFDVDEFMRTEGLKVWASQGTPAPYNPTPGPFDDSGRPERWVQRRPGNYDPSSWMWSPWSPK